MTYLVEQNGRQYLVIGAGGHPKITEESIVLLTLLQCLCYFGEDYGTTTGKPSVIR
jgi:hypothetical protein